MKNLLEPWVLLRLAAGLLASLLLVRAALTGLRVLRNFDLARASEGQLALERRLDLATTFVRVGAVVQVLSVAFAALGADRLSRGIRGAMCGYGVFQASPWGFRSLVVTVVVALVAGVLAQLFAFDARVRSMELVRPLAVAMLALAPLSLVDLALTTKFLLDLDLTVVASCCSVELDASSVAAEAHAGGPRVLATICALVSVGAAIGVGLLASRRPVRPLVAFAGALSLAAFPWAVAAVMLEVAPHAFEVPQHVCPFCLLKPEVMGLGYPLFGAMFLAVLWGVGAGVSGLLARGPASMEAFPVFAAGRLRRASAAWALVLLLGIVPVLRYAMVSGFAPLFR